MVLVLVVGCGGPLPPNDHGGAGGGTSAATGSPSTGATSASSSTGSGDADCTATVVSCTFDVQADGGTPECMWWDNGAYSTPEDAQGCCASGWNHYNPVIGTACSSVGLVGCCVCPSGNGATVPFGHLAQCFYEGDAAQQQLSCSAGIWGTDCEWSTTPPP